MVKKVNQVILILFCCLFTLSSKSQVQKSIPDYIVQRFLKYTEAVPREEIYVQTDRKDYISGEELWFNIYMIDRQSFRPSLISRIVYFELLNTENRPVVQKKILIDKGFGPGQILLPDSLSSGTYTIRAYTSWMKNFLPYNCFMKDIRIYNPLNKKAYRERVYSDKNTIKNSSDDIPEKSYNGLNLKIDNNKADTLELLVSADARFRSDNGNNICLFIQTHGIINHVSNEKILSGDTRICIPKKEMIPGVNHITIFDSNGQPVKERFIYTPAKGKEILMLNSTVRYNKRSKISLDIEVENELSPSLNSANLSISVAPKSTDPEILGIGDYMVFGTEYESVSSKIIKAGKISELGPETMDSILLNVKSNWINWAVILSNDIHDFKYKSEKEDYFLPGKLLNYDQNRNHSPEYVILSTPGKVAGFQYARTDTAGNFSFNINIDQNLKDLIISPDDISKNHKIIIESSFSDQYLKSRLSPDSVKRPELPDISVLSFNYQVGKIYGVSALGHPLNSVSHGKEPLRFYGKPDIELILADYVKLPKMEEVFFELLPRIYMKKKKATYEISIADRVDDSRYELSPSLYIDGVIIKDPSMIANLDPEIVEKIDVIKEKYYVGKYTFSGIVNVITKAGDFSSVSLPEYMVRLPYRVVDPVFSFASPDYSSTEIRNSRFPDFRNTLYWNPSVSTDKQGKIRVEFWASDVVSDYEINIQGITSDGKFVTLVKTIKVE